MKTLWFALAAALAPLSALAACPNFAGNYVDVTQGSHFAVTQTGCGQMTLTSDSQAPQSLLIDGLTHSDGQGGTTQASWDGSTLKIVAVQGPNQFSESISASANGDLNVITTILVGGQTSTDANVYRKI